MQYLDQQDVLAILRSDMYIEFFKFLSRSNYSHETIESLGKIPMNKPCHKIRFCTTTRGLTTTATRSSTSRSDNDGETRLLVIGTSSIIDSYLFIAMGSNGLASLSDKYEMSKHNDYVRDILIINDGSNRYIVTASLDKSVIFWDLDTYEYKFTRTGHSAGVESLQYGGKSLLFAGGYDYTILIWDITAAINRPLFQLINGHQSCVVRINALESIDRCCSLDESGLLCWWDISRNIIDDNRLIDTTRCPEDHANCFDMFIDLPHYYEALHGVIFLVAGKRQHIFKMKDVSSHESSPICVLYSKTLLSLFTIHSHEIIFWNIVSGDEYKTIKKLVSEHVKITCGCLDDRGRRIIIGDTSGTIRYYNCLNGHPIKVLDSIGVPIKELTYSKDKNLIILTENSDIIIIDDLLEVSVDYTLRSCHFTGGGTLSDIVCWSYCQELGLIATVDILGMLIIWDYMFLCPDIMIQNVSGNHYEVASISFLDEFPILVLVDNNKNISILTLETRSGSNKKYHLWRLDNNIPVNDNEDNNNEDEDEVKSIGVKARPYNISSMKKFLQEEGEAKHMIIHCEEDYDHDHDGNETDMTISEKLNDDESRSLSRSKSSKIEATDSFSIQPKVSQSSFPKHLVVRVICGYDDGSVCVNNITQALRDIDVGRYNQEDHVSELFTYNPKTRCTKTISESDCRKVLTSEQVKSLERYSINTIECIKDCHRGPISSLLVVGGFQWIVTASEDKSVMLWDYQDLSYQGLLTRGSEMDKLFRKHWKNPEDMETRTRERVQFAKATTEDLDLVKVAKERIQRNMDKLNVSNLDIVKSKGLVGKNRQHVDSAALTDPRDLVRALEKEALGGSGMLPVTTDTINQSLRAIEKFPERTRLLCQLEDKVTYEPSKKDIARLQLQSSSSMSQLNSTNNTNKMKKRNKIKKRKKSMTEMLSGLANSMDEKYLRTIEIADECLAQNTEARQQQESQNIGRLGKWQYALEANEIDAKDPGNWEISSMNRQREMYPSMFHEMAKNGKLSNDQEKIIMEKLKALCPHGNVEAYFQKLKRDYRKRMQRKHFGESSKQFQSSAKCNVYDAQTGKMITVTNESRDKSVIKEKEEEACKEDDIVFKTDDYDEELETKQGILIDDEGDQEDPEMTAEVNVVSMNQLLQHSSDEDSESEPSLCISSTATPQQEENNKKFFKSESMMDNLKRQSSASNKLLTSRHSIDPLKQMVGGGLAASILPSKQGKKSEKKVKNEPLPTIPASKSNNLLDPPDFIAKRRTDDLVKEFESKMKKTEKESRKASRQTRKKVRQSKRSIRSRTNELVESARFLTNPLEVTEKLSADFVNEKLFSKWGEKAKELIADNSNKKKKEKVTIQRMPTMQEITTMLVRTSSNISETLQIEKAKEEKLLSRKTFGPYVTNEMIQIFDLFKLFPKQIPGPADTVLMAGKDPAEEMGDGHTTNPVYGCIDLADFVKHHYIRSRPHFKQFLDKLLLIQRPDMTAGLFITLNRIVKQICPLMSAKDREDLYEFFKVYKGQNDTRILARQFSRSHHNQLKKIFDYFDKDRNGRIDKAEIREVLNKTYQVRVQDNSELIGNEGLAEQNIKDTAIQDLLVESESVYPTKKGKQLTRGSSNAFFEEMGESDDEPTMDFDAFLNMFGAYLLW